MPWFVAGGQPQYTSDPMDMLGATMGQGLSSLSGGGNVDYSDMLQQHYDEETRRWDAEHGLKQQQLDQQYSIAKMNASTQAEQLALDKWYRKESIKLEREKMAQQERQFNTTTGVNLMGMASQLRGPKDLFQAMAFSRGLGQVPEVPTFLEGIRGNAMLSAFQAPGGVPDPETLNSLMAKVGGDPSGGPSASGTGNPNAALDSIRGIASQGAHRIKGLERLNPMEMGAFQSGLDAVGVDTPSFLSQYNRSRIRNNISSANVA